MKKSNKKNPWLASYPKGVEWDHPIASKPLYAILDQAAAKFPEHTAIDFLGKTYSYQELHDAVNCTARGLKRLGVKKGTKVGIMLPNCPHSVISYFAILKTGGTVVNLSPLAAPMELQHQIKDSGTKIVISLDVKVLYEKIRAIADEGLIDTLVTVRFAEALPALKGCLFRVLKGRNLARVKKDAVHVEWSALACAHDEEFEPAKINPAKDIAVLQYTGGTTGTPKAAELSHENLYANAQQCALWCSSLKEGNERLLGVLPLFHCFAMTTIMNMGLFLGAALILHPRFEIKAVLKDIAKKKPTLMPGVPSLFAALANEPSIKNYNLTSLKICISGGAPLPMEIKQRFEHAAGCMLLEGYGLTEAAPVVAANPLVGTQKACIGLPLPQTEILIENMEKRGQFLGVDEIGELCVRGPQVMRGYWKNKKETDAVLKAGVLRTGDIGYFDKDGYFYIVDRRKDMILTHGFNVYPRNIEEAIYKHASVLEVAVIGVDDKKYGQAIKAFVVVREGQILTEDILRGFLLNHLAKYEMPREFEFRESLPKTLIGKIDKKPLR